MRWTFVRHAQSLANAQGWFAGQRDPPLTSRGVEQAHAARVALADVPFDRGYCSDLARAHDTARVLLEGRDVPLVPTPVLRERSCGTWEGRPIAELERTGQLATFRQWTAHPGGGESLRDVALRVCTWIGTLPEADHTLIVAHGALMRSVLGALDGTKPGETGSWYPENCEVATRDVPTSRWAQLAAAL